MMPKNTIRDLIDKWPFALGESPFHIKGVAYKGTLESISKDSGSRLSGVKDRIADERPELSKFIDGPFLASSKYDVFGLPLFTFYVAQELGRDFKAHVYRISRAQLEADLSGVYRFLLKLASPERVLKQIVLVTNQYFDFGEMELLESKKKSATMVRRDFPLLLLPWYEDVAKGYGEVALERAGAKDPKVLCRVEERGAKIHSLEAGDLYLDASWR